MQGTRLAVRLLLLDLDGSTAIGEDLRELLQAHLEAGCLRFEQVEEEGLGRLDLVLRTINPDLVLVVSPTPPPLFFSGLLRELKRFSPSPPVVAVLDTEDFQTVEKAMRQGVADVLIPPFRNIEVLARLVHWVAPRQEESRAWVELKSHLGLEEFIGEDPRFIKAIRRIPAIAQTGTRVLITGETGTGKDLAARAIHKLSARKVNPFYPVNCATLRPDLMENELFGHKAGAFTGASTTTQGIIASAHTGTLFLDEVQALTPGAQAMFLRFLEDGVWRSVGSPVFHTADVRIIAASNRDLEAEVRQKRFREDLFHRLNVMRLRLPPLRERPGDIEILARHFLQKHSREFGKALTGLTLPALHKLAGYSWPGNVRELENVIERAVALAESTILEAKELDLNQRAISNLRIPFRQMMASGTAELARRYLVDLLRECNGNVSRAARQAGMRRTALQRLLRKTGDLNPDGHG